MRRAVIVGILFPVIAAGLLLARLGLAQEIGGSKFDNGPWVSAAANITCGTGSVTTQTSNSRTKALFGKTVLIEFDLTITTIGTCATSMAVPLGFTAAAAGVCPGRELNVGGKMVALTVASAGTTGALSFYDNTLPNASSNRIVISCVLEST